MNSYVNVVGSLRLLMLPLPTYCRRAWLCPKQRNSLAMDRYETIVGHTLVSSSFPRSSGDLMRHCSENWCETVWDNWIDHDEHDEEWSIIGQLLVNRCCQWFATN